jgi:hypothetical protein
MKCAALGFVSAIGGYKDKTTQMHVSTLAIACGKNIVNVKVDDASMFNEMDQVVVIGELSTYNREMYFTNPKVLRATIQHQLLFAGREMPDFLQEEERGYDPNEDRGLPEESSSEIPTTSRSLHKPRKEGSGDGGATL